MQKPTRSSTAAIVLLLAAISCREFKLAEANIVVAPRAIGAACDAAEQCSAACVEGVCCERACDASESCVTPAAVGRCVAREKGAPCSGNEQCPGGFCTDGICCASADRCKVPAASGRSRRAGTWDP